MIIPLYYITSGKLRYCESRLAAEITAVVTSLTVTTGEGVKFPTYFPFSLQCEDEIMTCTDLSTDTLTVERGEESTSATIHASGTPIRAVLCTADVSEVHDEPVDGATTVPISSNWAYDYVKEKEEEQELNDLETSYNTIMANERYTSDRRGYQLR